MQLPFQCLVSLNSGDAKKKDCTSVLVACGPRLLLLSLERNEICSEWSSDENALTVLSNDHPRDDGEHRPPKKQKLAPKSLSAPMLIKLAVSPDERHVVAVTDDKCLRVFDITGGVLSELSQRTMPKRPCAVQVLPDNETIICGDKFGDVYSLPLLSRPMTVPVEKELMSNENDTIDKKAAFKPSATSLTVHTKRNRKALEAQLKQQAFTAKKEPLKFEHKLLLGHVSMLTDMLYASDVVDGKYRHYIITADRDEHIRISRGPPQAHIIEGYCLGHKEYISKLCLIPGRNLLISGGGDDWIGIWKWPTFNLVKRLRISHLLGTISPPSNAAAGPSNEATPHATQVNVSGLYSVPYISKSDSSQCEALIVVLEGVPALYITRIAHADDWYDDFFTLNLSSPPLDMACLGDSFIVALDGRINGSDRIQAFKIVSDEVVSSPIGFVVARDTAMEQRLTCLREVGLSHDMTDKALDELLYGAANMRKRRGWPSKDDGAHEGGENVAVGGEEDEDGE